MRQTKEDHIDLVVIDEFLFESILEQHAIPSGLRLIRKGFYLQQDNGRKHSQTFQEQQY